MYPQLNFGLFTTGAYTFFTVTALVVAVIGSYWFARRRGFKSADSLWMLFGMGMAVFIGARLFNVFVNYAWYRSDPSRIFSLSASGFSLYGGIVFAILAGFLIARIRKIPLMKFADTVTPFIGIGIVLMRIGCFLNGCCFGKITSLPWGVTFPKYSPAHMYQISQNPLAVFEVSPVHPTQIYEMIAAVIGTILALYILSKTKNARGKHALPDHTGRPAYADGTAYLAFAIFFSAFRWLNMQFRVLTYSDATLNIWYPLFYAAIIIICALLLIKLNKPKNNR